MNSDLIATTSANPLNGNDTATAAASDRIATDADASTITDAIGSSCAGITAAPSLPSASLASEVSAFLTATSELQQNFELHRIANEAFHANPFDVLGVSTRATAADIARQFRSLSLLTHPDKVSADRAELAQRVFVILNSAKTALTETDQRAELDQAVEHARESVLAKSKHGAPSLDGMSDADLDRLVQSELKEILIERAWRARVEAKAAAVKAKREEAEKAAKSDARAAEHAEHAELENAEKRQSRVNSWQSFLRNNGGALGRRPPRVDATAEPATKRQAR